MKNALLALLLITLLISSCARPKYLVYKRVDHVRLEKAGFTRATLGMQVTMYNPNKYGITLKQGDIDVYADGLLLGKLILNEKSRIPKKDTFSLPLLLSIDVLKVLPKSYQLLTAKQITLKLNGVMKAGKYGLYVRMPVLYEGKQNIR